MDVKRLTGVKASALKYDLLTALSVTGLHQTPRHQIAIARLTLLLTARYNWRADEFCVGQRDLARMWNVTERTVKREIKYWIEQRLVICKRQGVRGKVGAYRLNYHEIYRQSEPYWFAIGPDFQERMSETYLPKTPRVVSVNFSKKNTSDEASAGSSALQPTWRAARQLMSEMHPHQFQNWLASLRLISDEDGMLTLGGCNQFAAEYIQTHLLAIVHEAVEATLGRRKRIRITTDT